LFVNGFGRLVKQPWLRQVAREQVARHERKEMTPEAAKAAGFDACHGQRQAHDFVFSDPHG
jgi:hypothetical protein